MVNLEFGWEFVTHPNCDMFFFMENTTNTLGNSVFLMCIQGSGPASGSIPDYQYLRYIYI